MTQNGPYPGRPSPPWSTGGSGESYQQPADPWGGRPDAHQDDARQNDARQDDVRQDGWGGHPLSIPPGGEPSAGEQPTSYLGGPAYPGYPPARATAQPAPGGGYLRPPAGEYGRRPATPAGWTPPPPPPRGRRAPLVALVTLAALLVCGGLGTTAWMLMRDPDPTAAGQGTAPSPTAPGPAAVPNGNPGPPLSSKDARFVSKGQCVRNEGTADAPAMSISVCATGAYEVLARIDGRTTGEADAEAKCAKVPSYSKWYFYDSELDSLDFVLCLRER